MDDAPSIARRLQERWMRLVEKLISNTAGTEGETARGEFTSAFIGEKHLADYRAREDAKRNAFRPPVS